MGKTKKLAKTEPKRPITKGMPARPRDGVADDGETEDTSTRELTGALLASKCGDGSPAAAVNLSSMRLSGLCDMSMLALVCPALGVPLA